MLIRFRQVLVTILVTRSDSGQLLLRAGKVVIVPYLPPAHLLDHCTSFVSSFASSVSKIWSDESNISVLLRKKHRIWCTRFFLVALLSLCQ